MDVALIAVFLIASYLIWGDGVNNDSRGSAPTGNSANARALAAIRAGITQPLGLPDKMAFVLLAQSILETGNFKAKSFLATNSLFNRHKGSGRGEWTGKTYYANAGDQDLRIFVDVEQSARDMRQLLTNPPYLPALHALQQGDPDGYYNTLQAVGFSTDTWYASSLKKSYREYA